MQQLRDAFRGRIKEWVKTVPEDFGRPIRHRSRKEESESEDEQEKPETHGFMESAGKINAIPFRILAPKDEIYQKLSESGIVSSKFKKPMAVRKLIKRTDAEIVGWYHYLGRELLEFHRICDNLSEVKAIVEYHIRWSAIRTLAKKYDCNEREIVRKYGRDLQCEDKKGNKVALMSRHEIKCLKKCANNKVQITDRFKALKVLQNMED